MLDIICLV
ncbi:uncharacterized protein FTOL_13810 [Fusarium torulosum]|uniref:Uncharacterized protein n=1 Tax=Fusarium torulosum TaxID=33205 RepID=A0AAE8MQ32_9HYPO|nr:uncharacterized protein FTOL_13810 [Fusarium torulosum]